ncbi:ANTAR domain-containing protein [Actinocrinis puniceicyclus]|uniref:ANTAR domain-containing protein n=1 Tax=Actinocrinis puniceicyclus TaxID=977794 RepID=A0A8J8BFL1_9ACTN|nr:ANTAR domain-containing protein [Actinocrinis puniceicyclus]MBS2964854.1 ANTAR domain-containing protein [Actinocrinis puniceicyclus]
MLALWPREGGVTFVVSERMAVVITLLGDDRQRGANPPPTVAAQAAAALGVDGVCAGLGTGSSGQVLVWGQDATSIALEDLQFTLGQGPGMDVDAGAPVLVSDLEAAAARWPVFVPAAAALGVRALFALPLRIGAIHVGALQAYRANPGSLDGAALSDAFALAEAVTLLLLHRQAAAADPGGAASGGPQPDWSQPVTFRAQVHQATGMISAQLGVTLAEALVRLRAHAYVEDRLIAEVAADVVARRLRFENDKR